MIQRYLRFEPKIGWSEVIAGAALILALLAFVESRSAARPLISIEHFPIAVGPVPELQSGAYKFAAVLPLVFSNSGGRATTLLSFRRSEDVEPLLFGLGPKLLADRGPSYELFLSERMISSDTDWQALGPKRMKVDLSITPLLNIVIPPGESRIEYLGILVDAYAGLARKTDRLLYALEAAFSDSTTRPIRGAINVTPLLKDGDAWPVPSPSEGAPGRGTAPSK